MLKKEYAEGIDNDSLLYATLRITDSRIMGDEICTADGEEFTAQLMLWSAYEALKNEKAKVRETWKDVGEMKDPFLKKVHEIWDIIEEQGLASHRRHGLEKDVLLFLWYLCTEGPSKLIVEKPSNEREYIVRMPKSILRSIKRL